MLALSFTISDKDCGVTPRSFAVGQLGGKIGTRMHVPFDHIE